MLREGWPEHMGMSIPTTARPMVIEEGSDARGVLRFPRLLLPPSNAGTVRHVEKREIARLQPEVVTSLVRTTAKAGPRPRVHI